MSALENHMTVACLAVLMLALALTQADPFTGTNTRTIMMNLMEMKKLGAEEA